MGRYLVKLNLKRRTADYVKIPKGKKLDRTKYPASSLKGYRKVTAPSHVAAINKLLKPHKIQISKRPK